MRPLLETRTSVPDLIVVTTALPTRTKADEMAGALVDEHLAACVQVTGPVTSTYRWKGAVERAEEWRCEIKSTKERWPQLQERITALHPYEVPEIVMVAVETTERYGKWVRRET